MTEAPRRPRPPERRPWRPSPALIESVAIFVLFFGAYFAIGYRVVVDHHLVNFDALARLAHAFFVWHNDPPKLAAIGFVWPPVQTIAFLPFTLIKPVATSLAALPATSAVFAAGMMATLNGVLRLAEMPRWARWPLLLAFGANPMVVYYAANGMGEMVYLSLLVAGVYFFLRWYATGGTHLIALVGLFMGLAPLARYEMVPFAVLVGAAIALILVLRQREARELEGALLLYVAPVVYLAGSWLFFNWLILGDPVNFLKFNPASADISTSQAQVAAFGLADESAGTIAEYLLLMNFALFPLAVVVFPALIASAAAKRDAMSLVLAALVATNAAGTAFLFWRTQDPNLFQLRYNMRAIPLALIGAAWLYYLWRRTAARHLVWGVALAVLAVSLPLTWQTMKTYPFQYEENVFLAALANDEDQEGNIGIAGYPIGIASEQQMADYVSEELPDGARILTDDAQSLGVMLLSGRPDTFIDRIDRGDERFARLRDDPFGRVDYFLVATDERCRLPCRDLVRSAYPGILEGDQPGMRVEFSTPRYVLVALDEEAP